MDSIFTIVWKIINIVSSAAIDFPILNLTSFNLMRKNVIIGCPTILITHETKIKLTTSAKYLNIKNKATNRTKPII